MLGIFSKLLGGLAGPFGSLFGVVIDKIVGAIWLKLEAKLDASHKFSGDVKAISLEAKQLNEELDGATQPEEYKAILKKIVSFQDRVNRI